MNEGRWQEMGGRSPSRRQAIASAAMVCGGLVAAGGLRGASGHASDQATKESGCSPANSQLTSLRQEIDLTASPQRIYRILLDSKQFSAFTGAPAEIHNEAGGAFSLFGNAITGRNIELVPDQRIVQAWRSNWGPGVYSVVRFELKAHGSETHLVLDHTGFPEGAYEHLNAGWKEHYWEPLKKFLS
jgi:activator of HSP90 ATPase